MPPHQTKRPNGQGNERRGSGDALKRKRGGAERREAGIAGSDPSGDERLRHSIGESAVGIPVEGVRDHLATRRPQGSGETIFRRIDLAQVRIRLGAPDLAVESLGSDFAPFIYEGLDKGLRPWGLATRVRAFLAAGEKPERELLPAFRAFVSRLKIPHYARELRSVERMLAPKE